MASWPSTLPQSTLVSSYRETTQEQVIRTKMEVGPDFVRRRATASPVLFGMSMVLTNAQVETMDAFFDNTLFGGVGTFDWEHPRTGTAGIFRFVSRPIYSALGGLYYSAEFSLELLP